MSLHSSPSSSNRSTTSSIRAAVAAAARREEAVAERAAAAERAARIAQAELAAARAAKAAHQAAAEAREAATAAAALRGRRTRASGRTTAPGWARRMQERRLLRLCAAERTPSRPGPTWVAWADAVDVRLATATASTTDAGRFDGRRRDFDRDERAARDANAWLEREERREARDLGGRDAGTQSPHGLRASPSPDRRRGRRGRLGSPLVVQTIVKDAGGGWPMLTKTNYAEWSMVMKVKMQARRMWDAV